MINNLLVSTWMVYTTAKQLAQINLGLLEWTPPFQLPGKGTEKAEGQRWGMTLVSPQDVGRGGFLLSLFFFLSTLGRVKYPYLWWQRGSGSPHWSRVKPDQCQQGKIRGVSLTLPVKILHEGRTEIRAKQYPPKQKITSRTIQSGYIIS